MLVKEILRKLDLGNSVAEFDAELMSYFVETQTFRALVRGDVDIVAGDKGTRNVSMKMRHFQQIFSVPRHRSLATAC
jgi:hypothetical protein